MLRFRCLRTERRQVPIPPGSGLGDMLGLLFPLQGRLVLIARGVCLREHLAEEDPAPGPSAWPVLRI